MQIAYSLIEEQEGRKRAPDDYISFVGLLADPRYCGTVITENTFTFQFNYTLVNKCHMFLLVNKENKSIS